MKKIIYTLLPMIVLLFVSVGCEKEVIREEAVVTISDTEVIFSKDAEDKVVTVTVSTGSAFTAKWSNEGAEWGEVTEDETTVTISVNANENENSRSGLVTITTADGKSTKIIAVHQNGTSVTLDIIPENLKFNQHAGSKTIVVTTNATNGWAITGANDWVTVTSRQAFNEAIITVTENTTTSDREVKLIVTAGGDKKEIVVTQNAPLNLIMPYLDFTRFDLDGGNVLDSIKKFELERGSVVAGLGSRGTYHYRTPSENFPEIWYTVNTWGGGYLYQIILQPSNYEVLENKDFIALFAEHGFAFVYTTENNYYTHYWRESDGVELRIDRPAGEVQFFYGEPKPQDPSQTEDYPTFTTLPLGYIEWSATKADIHTWELAKGSTKIGEDTIQGYNQIKYKPQADQAEYERIYWIYQGRTPNEYMQNMLMYEELSLGYYIDPKGEYRLTRELKKLITDNGYILDNGGTFDARYINPTTKMQMVIEIGDYFPSPGVSVKVFRITNVKNDFNQPSGTAPAFVSKFMKTNKAK